MMNTSIHQTEVNPVVEVNQVSKLLSMEKDYCRFRLTKNKLFLGANKNAGAK